MHRNAAGLLRRIWSQVARFATVGLANTLVDFAAFNALLMLFRPAGAGGLAAMAAAAAVLATLNSYVLNSRWTFRDGVTDRQPALRFAGFAALGIAVQTGVALFVSHQLLSGLPLPPLVAANLAKLAAVASAVLVTFAGYRIAVFTPPSLRRFHDSVSLLPAATPPARTFAIVLTAALLARLGFWFLAPVAYGDAVSYSWVAWAVGHGRAGEADVFWHSLFDYWQAGFVWAGIPQYLAMVLASLVPGVLLTIPVMLLASRLYGHTVALVAGLVTALHPRLVEYSVNGYAESFFLHAAVWGVLGVTALMDSPRRWRFAVAAGAGLASWVLVRNESLPLALALLALPLLARLPHPRRARLAGIGVALATAATVTALVLAADVHLFGKAQLFAKAANASRVHVEMLDPEAAARETYSGAAGAQPRPSATVVDRVATLAERWPRNVAYTLERLPGMLLSPLFLAALLLPALVRRRAGNGAEGPLLLFTAWPLLFYPLLQLEPRMLFPVVMGVGILGAAGMVALGRFLSGQLDRPSLRHVPAAATALLLAILVAPLALRSEAERGPHRGIGAWLDAHVPASVSVSGDGYGYASTSGFWSGRRVQPRPWSESGEELGRWLAARGPTVMLVYDRFRREFNPGLELAEDGHERGMVRIAVLPFRGRDQVEVWANQAAAAVISRQPAPGGPDSGDSTDRLAAAR